MSYRERQRLADIQAAIDAIRSHLQRDHLAHRYFDTAHAIFQATVDEDLPDLERAARALARSAEKEDPDTRPGTT
jgi:hypothetical protein